jgi:bidirectional [NiFe] hydrogenase diaphorase subunit
MIDIVIDGTKARAREGETILAVAQRIGIDIPTLCFHERLRPHRACRVCTVEVIRGDKTSYLNACNYQIREPLVVNTQSDGARAHRHEIVGSLLASAPGAKSVREIARVEGIGQKTGPDGERCIRCGLCVRVCAEVIKRAALTYDKGGQGTPYKTVTDACIGCATCAALCPTGAIVVEDEGGVRRIGQGKREFALVLCGECGRPITTQEHLAALRERRGLPDEAAGVCGPCKRGAFAQKVVAGDALRGSRVDT